MYMGKMYVCVLYQNYNCEYYKQENHSRKIVLFGKYKQSQSYKCEKMWMNQLFHQQWLSRAVNKIKKISALQALINHISCTINYQAYLFSHKQHRLKESFCVPLQGLCILWICLSLSELDPCV